jgi:hypothetical protein
MKDGHYHQIRIREEPFPNRGIGLNGQRTQVLPFCETAKVLGADSSQVNGFFLGEELLARSNSDHRRDLSVVEMLRSR